jgi:glycosyltransferase involved in cell wall biosynthesis
VQQVLHPAAAVSLVGRVLSRPVVARNSGSGYSGGVQLIRRLPLGKLSLGIVARVAIGVALNSEMVEEMREAGFRRIVRIPNGVDLPAEITPAGRREARDALGLQGQSVLFLGRLDEEKGAETLIRAWPLVETTGVTLLVVGDGPVRAGLLDLAASLGAGAASIRFCGETTDPGLFFRAADVVVVPSKAEGMSNVLLEAMAHGRPVIASDIAGARDVIDRPEVGILFAAGSSRALAEAIDRVLGDEPAAARMGRAAREHVAARFSVHAMVSAYERLYMEVSRP